MQSTLLSLFSQVSDPRRGQGKMYSLAPILLFTVLAMLAGAVSYRQVHAFIHIHLDRLNAAFGVSLRKAPAYTDLPLFYHPAAIRASAGFTPCGAGGATCDRRS
jgi:hypothetical protein